MGFRTLAYVEDYTTFAALAFGLRGIEALGASAQSTAEYVIVFHEFPNHGGTVRVRTIFLAAFLLYQPLIIFRVSWKPLWVWV